MSASKMYRIVIVEPSLAIRLGVKSILEEEDDFGITAMYDDWSSFQNRIDKKPFDIVLINPAIINFYRHFTVKDLLPSHSDVLMVAIHYGYVDSATLEEFAGVLNIYDDGLKIRKKLHRTAEALAHPRKAAADNIDLSEREKEILVSVAKGLTNKEIACRHCISVHTVISHRKNITKKTGIKTVSGLTVYAVFNNLVSQDDLL
jgi:DNA-binding NarL/FixJ family response regulator